MLDMAADGGALVYRNVDRTIRKNFNFSVGQYVDLHQKQIGPLEVTGDFLCDYVF